MKELTRLIKEKAYCEGDFILSSGEKSTYFIDMPKVAMTNAGQYEIYKNIMIRIGYDIAQFPHCYVGGPATGAIPIIQTIIAKNYLTPKSGFYVKKSPFSLEGVIPPENAPVVMIDDVVTSGKSLLDATKFVQETTKAKILKIVAVLDREQGAKENFSKAGYDLISIVKLSELKSA